MKIHLMEGLERASKKDTGKSGKPPLERLRI